MAFESNQTSLIVGVLIKLTSVEGVEFRFQNFYKDNNGEFTYDNEIYEYLAIDYDLPERNINLDNPESQIVIPAVPLVINILEAHNYFIDALIESYIMLQGFPTIPLIADDKAIISSYSIQDGKDGNGGVSLIIQAPDSAINARFPNIYYITGFGNQGTSLIGYLPEVPISNNAAIQ